MPGHPECPERLDSLSEWLARETGAERLRVESRPVSTEQLHRVHSPSYVSALAAACLQGPGYIDPAPTYVTPDSYEAALLAAGGTIGVLDAILDGSAHAGFAVVRPPGHHATPDRAMGFCLLNNVAIAARHAQSRGFPRVAVFDFDVHHGNGSQAVFEADPDVLYISTHQEGIYPLTGWPEEIGVGAGNGTVINIPLPTGTGDKGLLRVLDRIVIPAAARFRPDVILVSAGFDAHWHDPLAGLQMTTTGYGSVARGLLELANESCAGRILFTLEGGYDREVVAEGVLACLAVMSGRQSPLDRLGPALHSEPAIDDRIDRAIAIHSL